MTGAATPIDAAPGVAAIASEPPHIMVTDSVSAALRPTRSGIEPHQPRADRASKKGRRRTPPQSAEVVRSDHPWGKRLARNKARRPSTYTSRTTRPDCPPSRRERRWMRETLGTPADIFALPQ